MKTILIILPVLFLICQLSSSQNIESTGKPIGEIFTDFHYSINNTSKTTGFGINRAHFGYNFIPGNNFTAAIMVNIGSPEELSTGAKHRRYAYFKEASISWTKDKLNISMGITKTRLYDYQQKFWGKRYIADTFQSLNGYGFVADLGLAMDYKFNDIFKADFTIMNGEGYSEIQLDNSVKTSAGVTITPDKQFAVRVYADITKPHDIWQSTLIGFAGFKNDLITIGAEVSYKASLDTIQGHNAWGFSGTGGINVSKHNEIFVRYDFSSSVIVPGDGQRWNYLKDGKFVIFGVQHSFSDNIKTAINYQGYYPADQGTQIYNAIYLSALFRF
jgi:hypothetical protein